jgi:phosphoserine phosphatase
MIPVHLKYHCESLEARARRLGSAHPKIALFDLDNTLLVGDIGEAVFARLLADGMITTCTWGDYESFLRSDQTAAYRFVVEAMAGLSVRDVEEATVRVLNQPSPFVAVDGALVPVPKIHTAMREFIRNLQDLHYLIYVISASNQFSVRIIAEDFFGINPRCAFGLELKLTDGRLIQTLRTPYPISQGKADLYGITVGEVRPLITATDSLIDAPLLALTDPLGLSIWVGNNRSEFRSMKERLRLPQQFCLLQRPKDQNLRKRVRMFGEQWRSVQGPSPLLTET